MLPPAILLESRLLILAGPRIIRKSAQEATRVLFLTLFSGGVITIGGEEAKNRGVEEQKRHKWKQARLAPDGGESGLS
ncbi:hypothetical protein EKL29_21750 [Pantoea sp. YU22]|uniref:Uncharacterized protein n=1 Tax=Pantoea piersonii TaxID=2364647 RepID=A0AAJ5UAI0_9GAMM|nr:MULTISPECIES: hypothetical protein [Pantoea]RTY53505.1 hypothetical protein EKL29_21750 [Pantoea sp. YU22]WBG91265.1 hypothetical protein N5580_01460 [Pantoea piersonii]